MNYIHCSAEKTSETKLLGISLSLNSKTLLLLVVRCGFGGGAGAADCFHTSTFMGLYFVAAVV